MYVCVCAYMFLFPNNSACLLQIIANEVRRELSLLWTDGDSKKVFEWLWWRNREPSYSGLKISDERIWSLNFWEFHIVGDKNYRSQRNTERATKEIRIKLQT